MKVNIIFMINKNAVPILYIIYLGEQNELLFILISY